MKYHVMAFLLGFLLDLVLGDPHFLPHPVRLMGKMITWLEHRLRDEGNTGKPAAENQISQKEETEEQTEQDQKKQVRSEELHQGKLLAMIVPVTVMAVTFILLLAAYFIHPYAGVALEVLMTYQILAAKSLKTESMKVYKHLKNKNLKQARKALSMIVGRDTERLNEEGIAKAAVETIAENTCDGVIAPMLYTALGGPVLGMAYKAVNTMDSMVGYKNKRYLYFGRAAAKLDDVVNYIPARISAGLMIGVCFAGDRGYSASRALEIYRRDSRKHASPNSAQTESVCAGALGIRLGGDASYGGRIVRKPVIGAELRKAKCEDIPRADHLMYMTAWCCEILCLLVLLILM